MAGATEIIVRASPHPGQETVHNHPARFKVLAAGRRWGKTRLGVMECLDVASCGGRAWWICPIYKTGRVAWRALRRIATRIPGSIIRETDKEVTLPGGGFVTIRTAEDPKQLVSEGLDLAVFDEAGIIKELAWAESIRPALIDRRGRALFIGTPKGLNWFYKLYRKGQDERFPDWASWRYPTASNPFISKKEIEGLLKDMPTDSMGHDRTRRQEIEAEFLEGGGGVFDMKAIGEGRPPLSCVNYLSVWEKPGDGERYACGADPAGGRATGNWCVHYGMNRATGDQAFELRGHWPPDVFARKIDRLAREYRGLHWIEENNHGHAVLMRLRDLNTPGVKAYRTDGKSKPVMIDMWESALRNEDCKILSETTIDEHRTFIFTDKGTARADEDYDDDGVMSAAIANMARLSTHRARRRQSVGAIAVMGN